MFSRLAQLIALLTTANARNEAIFDMLKRHLDDQRATIAFLTDELSKTKIAAASTRAELRQTEQRLAASERDFEWARVRLNGIEIERADLIRRLIEPQAGPAMHFPSPMIESKLHPPIAMADGPSVDGAGTALPDDPKAHLNALVDLFRDEREAADDDSPMPRPS